MNSEKIKEIKNNLNTEIKLAELNKTQFTELVMVDLIKDTLTLINELESENEEVEEQCVRWTEIVRKKDDRIKSLKDRIAELEKEIEENAFYSKGYAQGIKNTYEVVIPAKLKEFANFVKSKLFDLGNIVNERDIDDMLKEFIK